MKYYVYISDAKVDMLLPQVPHVAKKKTATELGFDLKVFKASRTTEEDSEDNRISRLEAVVSFIRQYGKVGSVDDPDDFIDDTQVMRIGQGGIDDIAFFTGMTERTTFGLCGSRQHLIGGMAGKTPFMFDSSLYSILTWLKEYDKDGSASRTSEQGRGALYTVSAIAYQSALMSLPEQRLEFFAKRLLFEPKVPDQMHDKNVQVLLATPLYIAMTD